MLIKTEGNIVDLYILGNLCSNKCHRSSLSAREGEFPSQHAVGSKWAQWGGSSGEKHAPVTSGHNPRHWAGRTSLIIRGVRTGPCLLITLGLRTTCQAPCLPWGHPGNYNSCFPWAPSQVRREWQIDDHDAAWRAPRNREVARVPQGNRGGSSCHVGIQGGFPPRAEGAIVSIITPSLHPGTVGAEPGTTGTCSFTHSRLCYRSTWHMRSRQQNGDGDLLKVNVGSKPRLDKTARSSRPQVPPSERLEWNTRSWMERDERQRYSGGRTTESDAHRQGDWRTVITPITIAWNAATLQRPWVPKTALAVGPCAVS